MKTTLILFISTVVICAGGWKIYQLRSKKNVKNQRQKEKTQEDGHIQKVQGTSSENEQQRLLNQLRQQREEIAGMQYRQACGKLFDSLSGGIQDLLAQERRPYSRETAFCRRVLVSAENHSLRARMCSRPVFEEPEAISPDVETGGEEMLREMIRVERSKCHIPAIEIHWDKLIDSLLPCLERLLQAAEENRGDDCHKELAFLQKVLDSYKIYPIWHDDEMIQNKPFLQKNYIPSELYPIPALYYCQDEKILHIGAPGYTGSTEKK